MFNRKNLFIDIYHKYKMPCKEIKHNSLIHNRFTILIHSRQSSKKCLFYKNTRSLEHKDKTFRIRHFIQN